MADEIRPYTRERDELAHRIDLCGDGAVQDAWEAFVALTDRLFATAANYEHLWRIACEERDVQDQMLAAVERGVRETPRCSNCGKLVTASACGPTHAMLEAEFLAGKARTESSGQGPSSTTSSSPTTEQDNG